MRHTRALTVTVREAANRLGIGRNWAYAGVKCGEIPSIGFRRLLVPVAGLERLLSELKCETVKVVARVRSGTYADPQKMTIAELLDEWIATKRSRKTIANRTLLSYESVVRLHLRPVLGGTRVAQLSAMHIDKAIAT